MWDEGEGVEAVGGEAGEDGEGEVAFERGEVDLEKGFGLGRAVDLGKNLDEFERSRLYLYQRLKHLTKILKIPDNHRPHSL